MREFPNGRVVYEQNVRPAILNLPRVGAHYALSRTFDSSLDRVFAFSVQPGEERRLTAGRSRLLVGHASFRSSVTQEASELSYGVLHTGDHTTSCGVREFQGDEAFAATVAAVEEAFSRADFPGVTRVLDDEFGGGRYSIASLFRDEQHEVVRKILAPTLEQVDASYRHIYEQHAPMAMFLRSLNLHVPRRIQLVGSFVLSRAIQSLLEDAQPDLARCREIAEEAKRAGIDLDEVSVRHSAFVALGQARTIAPEEFDDVAVIRRFLDLALFTIELPFDVDLWPLQEVVFDRALPRAAAHRLNAQGGVKASADWVAAFDQLCEALGIAGGGP
jgi:hypothetical protein